MAQQIELTRDMNLPLTMNQNTQTPVVTATTTAHSGTIGWRGDRNVTAQSQGYGSYFGFIRLVELDPDTGMRLHPDEPSIDLAINCEAAILIYHDSWYYLLATHGSCCRGADSGYNIRVGRARSVNGPFPDNENLDMLMGGGKLFVTSAGRVIGPGHFGLLDLGDGVQKFSCHYEADLDQGGASVLDIRPLLWRDGWPVPGDNLKDGMYQLESLRTGTTLELAVEGMPVGGRRPRGRPPGFGGPGGAPRNESQGETNKALAGIPASAPGQTNTARSRPAPVSGGFGRMFAGRGEAIPSQDVAEVSVNWPTGEVGIRMGNFMCQAQQKWAIGAVPNSGGYPGSPYFRITIAGTERTLTATAERELAALPTFTGSPEQLWRFDQLADGTWRIMPKAVPYSNDALTLSAVGASFATLAPFEPTSEKQRWVIKAP